MRSILGPSRQQLAAASILFAAALTAPARCQAAEGLDGISSIYTDYLTSVLRHWTPLAAAARPADSEQDPLVITCIATRGFDRYVGMIRRQRIHAALADVEGLLDDVSHYKDLFPGTIDVRVLPGSKRWLSGPPPEARFDTAWVQRPPIFLMPNIRYEMVNVTQKELTRGVYRYQLRRGDKLIASDGLVILESVDATNTEFTEYDFFNADWGPLPTWLVWKESLKGAYQSDLAIRLKAEQPSWDYARVTAHAASLTALQSRRLEQCFANRTAVLP